MDIFKKASRKNLRFRADYNMNLTVEDLWNLPLRSQVKSSLDNVYSLLVKDMRENKEDSFFKSKDTHQGNNELRLKILEEIMNDRVAENEEKINEKSKESQKEKLLAILQTKKDQDLHSKSTEEIEKLISEL